MVDINISHMNYSDAMNILLKENGDIHSVHCHIEFWADHSQSKIIRDFVGMIFDAHNIHVPWRGRFILITDELINNAIEHGSIEDDLDSCIIEAGKNPDGTFHISLEVHDTGNGKDAEKAKDMLKVKEERTGNAGIYMEKRGRWLFHITEKLVDRLSFSVSPRGWLAVKVEKSIDPRTLEQV